MAELPELLHYQGRLVDGTNLVDGVRQMSFYFYNQLTGGSPLYGETQSVAMVQGLYDLHIGASNTVPGRMFSVFTNDTLFLEVAVDGTTLDPREQITSAGYALYTHRVSAGALTSEMLATGCIQSVHIANGQVVRQLNGITSSRLTGADGVGLTTNAQELRFSGGGLGSATCQTRIQLNVATSNSVAKGDLVTFDAGGLRHGWWASAVTLQVANADTLVSTALGSNCIVTAWTTDSHDYGYACVGIIQAEQLEWGSGYLWHNLDPVHDLAIERLSSNRFVLGFRDENNDDYGTTIIGTVVKTNKSMKFAPASVFNTNYTDNISLAANCPTSYFVAYQTASGPRGEWITGTVNAQTQTVWWYSSDVFQNSAVDGVELSTWWVEDGDPSTRMLVGYENLTNNHAGVTQTGNRYGGDIYSLSNEVFCLSDCRDISIIWLQPEFFVLAYRSNSCGYVMAGKEVSWGGYYDRWYEQWGDVDIFNPRDTGLIDITRLNSNAFAIACVDDYWGTVRRGKVAPVSLLNFSWDRKRRFGPGNRACSGLTIAAPLPDRMGVATHYTLSGPVTYFGICGGAVGVATEDAADGASCEVTIDGVTDAFTNLTPGVRYFDNGAWELKPFSRDSTCAVGLAIGTNSLLLNPQLRANWELP